MKGLGVLGVIVLVSAGCAQAAAPALSEADKAAAFTAAGFKKTAKGWVRCEDDVTMSYMSGQIEAADLNGDGAPEAWIREGSVYCYGDTGEAVVLLTRKASGWTVLLDDTGLAVVEQTKHNGWPDISVGGPGFGTPPLYRFNGSKYVGQ